MLFRLEIIACEASLTFLWPSADTLIYINKYKQQAAPRMLVFGPRAPFTKRIGKQTTMFYSLGMDKSQNITETSRGSSALAQMTYIYIMFLGIKT